MADGSRPLPLDEPVAPEILALACAIARGLARQHHEADERRPSTTAQEPDAP